MVHDGESMTIVKACATVGAGLLLLGSQSDFADAQQSAFCPTSSGAQSGIVFSGGECTNRPGNNFVPGGTGAFSNTALASQLVSEQSESTTQAASTTVSSALNTRRETERDRCAEGFERVGGSCQRIAAAKPPTEAPRQKLPVSTATMTEPGTEPARSGKVAPTARPRPATAAPRVATQPAPVYKALPPPVEPAVRYATWVEGISDYLRQSGTSSSTGNPADGAVLALNAVSRATMGGVLGGADATFRAVWAPNDVLIVGALTGYLSSNVRLTTTSTTLTPAIVGSGSATLNSQLQGPSAGAYVTYFIDRFSGDLTFRADLLNVSESWNDNLAFSLLPKQPTGSAVPGPNVPYANSGSTQLNAYSTTGNLNYRIPVSTISWLEPTAGFLYVQSDYASGAAALGLFDGHLAKVQGGLRYGIEYFWGPAKLTTTVTGLAYEDVSITGQNLAFATNGLILNDQGLLRGQGILALNLAYANGVALFAQGDVRGGKDLFGAGGKGGIRVTW
jgi:Autotransporter beta-domain